MTLTVSTLANKFGLSRSTLLYYDSIGLLSPAAHVKGEYRIYSVEEEKRLELICGYRKAGIALKNIKKILDSPDKSFTVILNERFEELNGEILSLYGQQKIIAGLLKNSDMLQNSNSMTKELWSSLLKASGFSDEDMRCWHINFEQTAPKKHLVFLQHLRISTEEISLIRGWGKDPQD
jgi:DNA-binding transcriptional MerR regulator